MEAAGAGAARLAVERLGAAPAPVVCVCGPGQNGGDGLVVARHLAVAGHRPLVVLLGEPGQEPPGDAGVNLRICRAMGLPIRRAPPAGGLGSEVLEPLSAAAWIVDGLFGTGLSRAPALGAAELIRAVTASRRPVLALDVPSGLDCDSGRPVGDCVRAALTATFAAPKIGFSLPESREWTGEVVVVPIGAPAGLAD